MSKGLSLYLLKLLKKGIIGKTICARKISFGRFTLMAQVVNDRFKDPDMNEDTVVNRIQVTSLYGSYVGYVNLGKDNTGSVRLPSCTCLKYSK